MLRKPSRNSSVEPDVPADDPVGTMDRFMAGLGRVLSAEKAKAPAPRKKRPKRPSALAGRTRKGR